MKFKKAVIFLSVFASSTFASVCPIEGKPSVPLAPTGYTLSTPKKVPNQTNQELIDVTPISANKFGVKHQWIITRSPAGKIISMETVTSNPTKDQLAYINSIKNEDLRNQAKVVDANGDSSSFQFSKAEDYPVRLGGKIELDYAGDECYIKSVGERYYDQSDKKIVDKPVYENDSCPEISALHNKLEKSLNECASKISSYSNQVTGLLNGKKIGGYNGGYGGGGSQPIADRSIASVSDTDNSTPFDSKRFLSDSINHFLAKSYNAKNLCDVLYREKRLGGQAPQPSNGGSSTGVSQ